MFKHVLVLTVFFIGLASFGANAPLISEVDQQISQSESCARTLAVIDSEDEIGSSCYVNTCTDGSACSIACQVGQSATCYCSSNSSPYSRCECR